MQVLLATLWASSVALTAATELVTVAEHTEYRATSRYIDVMQFCRNLAGSSDRVELLDMGRTVEGRRIPLLVVADPPVSSFAAARREERMVVMAFANIHAGEVCGKEALMMFARDLAAAESSPLLDDLIILLVPIYNADGNERFSLDNRPGQVGPEMGMGQRPNAQGLDLNRDHVKLESPEARALVTILNDWDPAVIIDSHTTNGSHHHYTLTYAVPRNPAGDAELINFARDGMMPEISRRMEAASGYRSFFYGNFDREHTRWSTYPDQPRFGTPYRGLRNRIGVLAEAYAYASFKDRVLATQAFVTACFAFAAEHKDRIADLIDRADGSTVAAGEAPHPDDKVAIRSRLVPFPSPVTIPGFEMRDEGGRKVATEQPRDYTVEHHGRFEPALEVARPYAYLLEDRATRTLEKLRQHGVEIEVLREDLELDVEADRVIDVARAERPFQGHRLITLQTERRSEARLMPAGTRVVRTAQPLGHLIVYLLEPMSADGLTTWDLVDGIAENADYPILRVGQRQRLWTSPDVVTPTAPETVDFEVVYGRKRQRFGGRPMSSPRWLPDGQHFLISRNDNTLKVDAATGRSTPFFDPDQVTRSITEHTALEERAAQRAVRSALRRMNDDMTCFMFDRNDDLYYARIDGSSAQRLTHTPDGDEQLPELSPDGKYVAFIRDNNLFVADVAARAERALTDEHQPHLRNGKTDWVYFEEVFSRNWKAYWWSPDSRSIAFLRFDDEKVGEFTVLDHDEPRQTVETTYYPKAGTNNPLVQLGIVDVASGVVRFVDLPDDCPPEHLITGVGWWPDGRGVWFYVQNRIQSQLDFCTVPASGTAQAQRLFRETTSAWVDPLPTPHFFADGSFLLLSERSGWRHLYHYGKDGTLKNAVTAGPWQVNALEHVDEAGGRVYFTANRDAPMGRRLYRCALDGTGIEMLTPMAGTHNVAVSPTAMFFTDSFSSLDQPTRVRLHQSDGTAVRWLDINPVSALKSYRFSDVQRVTIPAADGEFMHGTLRLPPDFDPEKTYPVWFMTYAGPQAPTVRDSWSRRHASDQLLAEMGLIVFRCDPRAANGAGARYSWPTYKRLGVLELQDIIMAIEWLKLRSYVDGTRIGMSGHSYGGFMTAYAMTHSKLFAAGIAGAPVTDWRNYDTIYTERYMDTPQANTAGYDQTSVVRAASDLHGRLLILHGAMDDNVHVANSMQLARALQQAGKAFEIMIYPLARHGLSGRHCQELQLDFIRRTLLN
jgi:dipeptidyl aminopeptidase/acylaminoacyl peptidase